ncbi:hypothetical protein J2T12_000985 [Paenibacillus anaericanus]|nr:hypothetical protein [Paenibacillus anaericanus]
MSSIGLLAPTPAKADSAEEIYVWTKTSTTSLAAIAYGNGLYVGIKDGYIYTSSDLVTWTQRDVSAQSNKRFVTVKFLNGKFYAATTRDNELIDDASFIYSDDGISWSAGSSNPSNLFAYYAFSSIAYANNKYLATSSNNGGVVESSTGIVWSKSSLESGNFYDIKYVGNRFIVSGANQTTGIVRQSTDNTGTNWGLDTEVAGTTSLNGLASNGSQVIAVGNGGEIVRTDDTSPELPTVAVSSPVTADLKKVVYDGNDEGLYVAVGRSNTIITSKDGLIWKKERIIEASNSSFYDVIYGNGSFVAVGDDGVYKRIKDLGAPTNVTAIAGNGTVTVNFDAPASDGGSAITGYTATSKPGGFTGTSTTASPITVTGLTNGTAYSFTVVATNSAGNSVASVASSSVTPVAPIDVPKAPTNVTAIAGNGTVTVSFDAPSSDGGSPITLYTVTSNPGRFTGMGTTASPITVTGLTNGTEYTFTVVATNIVGDSVASAASSSVTPVANASLSNLTLSDGATLNPTFASGTITYTVNVANSVNSIKVMPTVADSGATVKVNGIAVTSGAASRAISLSVGNNTITVETTAQDRTTKKSYTLIVKRASASISDGGSEGSPSSGGSPINPSPVDSKVTSTDGEIMLPVGSTGEVNLNQEIFITVPPNASSKPLEITIEKVLNTHNLLVHNEVLASSVFNVQKNLPENLNKPATLTMVFNPTKVSSDQTVAIFYYDEATNIWVEINEGKIVGNRIHVEVNNFMKFVVLVVDQSSGLPISAPTIDEPKEVNFSDIAGHWAESTIKQAMKRGVTSGYPDGTFKPDATITRTEFVMMLMNALKPASEVSTLSFTDMEEIPAWSKLAIAQAVEAGIVSGYNDGSFHPFANITRTEMAVMIAKAYGADLATGAMTGFSDDSEIPIWAKEAVEIMKQLHIVEGRGGNRFVPNETATRAEAVTMIMNLLYAKITK